MDEYQKFIAISRYARWIDGENRRETWEETVDRYIDNVVRPRIPFGYENIVKELGDAIKNLEVMPSMRALMTAGPALDRDNTCGYNCSYLVVDHPYAFDEALFILLCGTGVGFSVERQYINKLPEVPTLKESNHVVVVEDSKEGWSLAFRKFVDGLYKGKIYKWDVSKVRPAGARLKTFGGRASGPGPLVDLFKFATEVFRNAQGRKLSSIECHDLLCKIGEIVVVGGVRRSAMISLTNLSDDRMRYAKSGQWWENNPQRALANISTAFTEKPNMGIFLKEWQALVESGSGERGVFNREAAKKQVQRNGRRNPNFEFGTNPCSEIILRPFQFCNLTEVVIRREDDIHDLERKVNLATILGTIQSTYTHFPYLRDIWKKNTEEERLLGVSLTGIMDNPLMTPRNASLEVTLKHLKWYAIDVNKEWAKILGVNESTAITCVKPSGTVSQLVNSSSGIHPRYAPYYIRTVRGDNKDPLTQLMKDQGVPHEPDITKPDSTTVFSFPVKAPEGSVTTKDMSAIEQLEMWRIYQEDWTEHKPSVTIHVKDDEWLEVGAYVYKHFDEISGVSFLPYNTHTYQQAPYQEISKEVYENLKEKFPKKIDWSKLSEYEKSDETRSSGTFACSGDSCEIVDLT